MDKRLLTRVSIPGRAWSDRRDAPAGCTTQAAAGAEAGAEGGAERNGRGDHAVETRRIFGERRSGTLPQPMPDKVGSAEVARDRRHRARGCG